MFYSGFREARQGEQLLVVTVRRRKTEGRAGRRNGAETPRRMNTKKINISAQQQRGEEGGEEEEEGIKMLCERPQQEVGGGVIENGWGESDRDTVSHPSCCV